MHIHSFIYFIHYVRYARLLGNTRFLGTMVLMLLFSQFQLVIAKPASAMLTTKANHDHITIDFFYHGSTVSTNGEYRTDPAPPVAIDKKTYMSVFYRLKPGIVMVPRMNRTPKPKSVYGFLHACARHRPLP